MHSMIQVTGSADSLCPAFQAQCWLLCQAPMAPTSSQLTPVAVSFPPFAAFSFSLHFMLPLTTLHFPPFHDPDLLPLKLLFLQWWNRFRTNKHNGFREQHWYGVNQTYPRMGWFCTGKKHCPLSCSIWVMVIRIWRWSLPITNFKVSGRALCILEMWIYCGDLWAGISRQRNKELNQ